MESNEKRNIGIYLSLGIFLVIWGYRLLFEGSMILTIAKLFGAFIVLSSFFYDICIPISGLYAGYLFLKKKTHALTLFMVTAAVDLIWNLCSVGFRFWYIRHLPPSPPPSPGSHIVHISMYPHYCLIILEAIVVGYLLWEMFFRKDISQAETPALG